MKHQALPVTVTIENASKLYLAGAPHEGKVYTRYTGYPGGLREVRMDEMIDKKGIAEVVKKTIDGHAPAQQAPHPPYEESRR